MAGNTVQGFQMAIYYLNCNIYYLCMQCGIVFKEGPRASPLHFPNLLLLLDRVFNPDQQLQSPVYHSRGVDSYVVVSDGDHLDDENKLVESALSFHPEDDIDEFVVVRLLNYSPTRYEDD